MTTLEDTGIEQMTCEQFREMIQLGRRSIELRVLGVVLRPRSKTAKDEAEMNALLVLLDSYNELMHEKYWFEPLFDAANDSDIDGSGS